MQMQITLIMMIVVFILLISYFMFYFGQKIGISEGRRQVLEEDMKRVDLKMKYTAENLMILNLYESTNSQGRLLKNEQCRLSE